VRLYDSARGRVERLRPRPGRALALYACGITPYDTTHLGHAFTYLAFDVLARHASVTHGWAVRYVQNVTDIDDDILKRARETGEDWRALGRRWTDVLRRDLEALNLRPPDALPGATSAIPAIVDNVAALVATGRAYARQGSVYFRVASDPDFGAMARLPYEGLLALANERGNRPDDPNKDDPLDFVLWQAGAPGEPAWRSPWGLGRPGWHIECSTLATRHLGEAVDVHGGGADLLFPHHACEIAQAEPLVGHAPWVRFWMHVAMVGKDGEKMSKSLGNLVLVRDLLAHHEPDAVRLYLLGHHYRTPWEWDPDAFAGATPLARTLHAAAGRPSGTGRTLDFGSYGPRVTSSLDDDLDTPGDLDALLGLADEILAATLGADVAGAQDVLRTLGHRVLGLWLRPYEEVPEAHRSPWPEALEAPPDAVLASG